MSDHTSPNPESDAADAMAGEAAPARRNAPIRSRSQRIATWVTPEERATIHARAQLTTGGDIGEYVRRRCLSLRLHSNVGSRVIAVLSRLSTSVAERFPHADDLVEEIGAAIASLGMDLGQ